MADTIVNTPGTRSDDSANAVGWVVALIVILALIVAAFTWFRHGAALPGGTTSNVNVTLPNTGVDSGGSTGGTGAATQ